MTTKDTGGGAWQPIETLPDRTGEVLLYYPPEYGRNAKRAMFKIGRNNAPRQASHWMPLPAPPLAARKEES